MKVSILGAGISGLSTALTLLKAGFEVEVMAHQISPDTTSDLAAALWFPYEVKPKELAAKWGQQSFKTYQSYLEDSKSGVRMVRFRIYYDAPQDVSWINDAIPDGHLMPIAKENLPKGYLFGYSVLVPFIDTSKFMPMLKNRILEMGGKIQKIEKIKSQDHWLSLCSSPILVNCTGLGAKEIFKDEELYPIRGQIVRASKPDIDDCFVAIQESSDCLTHVFPRSDDCILGGTSQVGNENEEIDELTAKQIMTRSLELEPAVADIQVLEDKVGLRPGRSSIRLEKERLGERVLIHNYGHGGAGWTLAWGCAESVLKLCS